MYYNFHLITLMAAFSKHPNIKTVWMETISPVFYPLGKILWPSLQNTINSCNEYRHISSVSLSFRNACKYFKQIFGSVSNDKDSMKCRCFNNSNHKCHIIRVTPSLFNFADYHNRQHAKLKESLKLVFEL